MTADARKGHFERAAGTRTRITATPLYPGSFFPENGRAVPIDSGDPETAQAAIPDDGGWFCIEVRTVMQKRWTDGAGGEMWIDDGPATIYRIYVGEELTLGDVERLPVDHSILLSNMRGNDWASVICTRRGNFQPVEPGDVVIKP